MNLFEIQAKLDNIFNQVIENEGEINESLASELEIAQEELDDKLYAYSFVIDRYSSDIALLKQSSHHGFPSTVHTISFIFPHFAHLTLCLFS